jgi:hypothetical protein
MTAADGTVRTMNVEHAVVEHDTSDTRPVLSEEARVAAGNLAVTDASSGQRDDSDYDRNAVSPASSILTKPVNVPGSGEAPTTAAVDTTRQDPANLLDAQPEPPRSSSDLQRHITAIAAGWKDSPLSNTSQEIAEAKAHPTHRTLVPEHLPAEATEHDELSGFEHATKDEAVEDGGVDLGEGDDDPVHYRSGDTLPDSDERYHLDRLLDLITTTSCPLDALGASDMEVVAGFINDMPEMSIKAKRSDLGQDDDHYRCAEYALMTLQGDSVTSVQAQSCLSDPYSLRHLNYRQLGPGEAADSFDLVGYGRDAVESRDDGTRIDPLEHVGVVGDDFRVLSKWGVGPIVRHQVHMVPTSFGNKVFFYRKVYSPDEAVAANESTVKVVNDASGL